MKKIFIVLLMLLTFGSCFAETYEYNKALEESDSKIEKYISEKEQAEYYYHNIKMNDSMEKLLKKFGVENIENLSKSQKADILGKLLRESAGKNSMKGFRKVEKNEQEILRNE